MAIEKNLKARQKSHDTKPIDKNEKICLVMIREKLQGLNVAPFALLYIGTALEKKGFKVKILDISPNQIDATVKQIVSEKPLLIGFSVLTGLPTLYSANMSKKIKEVSQIPIVWGGVHPTLIPEQTLSENYVDFVIKGEGEETAAELAKVMGKKKDYSEIKGLCFKKDGKIILNEDRPLIKNLDEYRINFDLINLNDYIMKEEKTIGGKKVKVRRIGFISSRGCPHCCAFCYNQVFNKGRWRGQSQWAVIEDIMKLKKKHGINEVHFWDDNFFANKERAYAILEGINMPSGIEIRIDYVDEETAKKLKEFKVNYLLIGGESGSNRILRMIKKGFTVEQMMEKNKILAKYGIPVQYSFILGLPTETKKELFQTIDRMYEINRVHDKAGFTVGNFCPYPGTEMFDLAVRMGFVPPKKTEEWNLLDRWRNTATLPWANNKTCLNLRHMFAMLSWRNPLLKTWVSFRIKNKILNFDADLTLFIITKSILNRRIST